MQWAMTPSARMVTTCFPGCELHNRSHIYRRRERAFGAYLFFRTGPFLKLVL